MWRDTPDGQFCDRHDENFARGKMCPRCFKDPGEPFEPVTSEDIDVSLRADAKRYLENAAAFSGAAMDMLGTEEDGKTDRELAVAAKLSEVAIKWERLAIETKDKVSARDHDRKLIAHEREMSGVSH